MKKITSLFILVLTASLTVSAQTKPVTATSPHRFSLPAHIGMDEFIPNMIVLKVKPAYRSACTRYGFSNAAFSSLMNSVGGTGFERVFPFTPAPEVEFNRNGQRMEDLSMTYSFKYTSGPGLVKVINMFLDLGLFEYAEPMPLPKTTLTTNDQFATSSTQYHLFNIKAAGTGTTGWDISKGDSSIVIGITDTGTEPTHPDLNGNIKRNMAEIPNNGIDDDGDGYIDNYMGWDLGVGDNDPTWQGDAHGVHVSGISSAVTNNTKGVAGVGYNCKFLPVKIADATGALTKSYEGITYAADHGVKIINCSWGGAFGGSYGQSVINYATINKDILVVAAAGNNALDQDFYPSSFNGVLSVGATTSSNAAASFTNYNFAVGVCAPGNGIYSTYSIAGGNYTNLSGTSMASPCVAGVCAVVRKYFPTYNAYQTAARVKQTTINNYPSMAAQYAGKMGTGLVNLYAALTNAAGPWVEDSARQISDHNDEAFMVGDTLRIGSTYVNLLSPTTNLVATLSSTSPFVSIQLPSVTIGVLGTMAKTDNYTNPFKVKLVGAPAVNQRVDFVITYTDGTYSSKRNFSIYMNEDYINITVNDVATTVTSKSLYGFNDNPAQTQGLGFNYMGKGNLMYEGGLMVGVSSAKVSDNVRGATTPKTSFVDMQRVIEIIPTVVSNFDASGMFTDAGSATPLPVRILQKDYAYTSVGNRKFVMLEYSIKNTGSTALTSLYAGIFCDYDITAATASSNKDAFDATNRMGYAWYTGAGGIYAGTKLLSRTAAVTHYAIDNLAGGGGGIDISTAAGFSDANKYLTLSTNRAAAGTGTPAGNDVIDVTSSGPFTIAAGDSIQVAFALIAGDNLADLQNSAVNAQLIYDGVATSNQEASSPIAKVNAYPNPATGMTNIVIIAPEDMNAELNLFNTNGQIVAALHHGELKAGEHHFEVNLLSFPAGMYAYRLTSQKGSISRRLVVTK
jgi:serine protease